MNELNGKMGISAPHKSVPVMKLIRAHNPKSKEELVELIKWHSEHSCSCGIVSHGTVELFGKNLYDAQKKHWGEHRYSLQECIQWEYDLFVVQSLKGNLVEKKAVSELSCLLNSYVFEEAEGFVDEELRIDIVIKKEHKEVGGIQVKPETFKMMRREVITFNREANKKWKKPVFYLFYNAKEEFINISNLVREIQELQ